MEMGDDRTLLSCLVGLFVLVLVIALFAAVVGYVDDWVDAQAQQARAKLAQAEADRARAEAERARAEAVRDYTAAVQTRMTVVDLLPWLPVIVLVTLLAPALVWALAMLKR